jgi:hypothetical protein
LTALVRVGLGLLVAFAPALCCCHARWLTAGAATASAAPVAPAERPEPVCPHCRAEHPAPAPSAPHAPTPKPAPAKPHCIFCDGQASVIPTDPAPQPEIPALTGELIPVLVAFAVTPAHPSFRAGLFPSEWTGVDARSAALFDRHVLRC